MNELLVVAVLQSTEDVSMGHNIFDRVRFIAKLASLFQFDVTKIDKYPLVLFFDITTVSQ